MKLFYPFVLILAISVMVGCKKKEPLKDTPPLLLLPQVNGQRLSDAELNGMKLTYYINQESRKKVSDFKRAENADYQRGILSTYDVAELSTVNKINTYYLTYPNGQEDTFKIIYTVLSEKDARKDICFCHHALTLITRNQKPLFPTGENVDGAEIYAFEK